MGQAAWLARLGLGHEQRGEQDRPCPRGCSPEHTAPAHGVDQGAADDRPHRHAEPEDAAQTPIALARSAGW